MDTEKQNQIRENVEKIRTNQKTENRETLEIILERNYSNIHKLIR